jgi:hypothetical protein
MNKKKLEMKNMNIYAIKTQGETEWICANTVFQALKLYHYNNDLEIVDYDDEDDIEIVPKEEWSKFTITDPDLTDENGNDMIIQTFEDFMKTATEPEFIASTIY